ncbi:nucleotidyltransferase domain-containing protein [Candidatus Bathyarchaeota archaeon]|nr:nucleotidyltransferase domain-containing protein [Candidatus Bathyarchaeota archaeon]
MVWLLERLSDASEDLIRVLVDEFIGLILFGSWARGEAKVDSDVDLFIVLRKAGGMATRSSISKTISSHVRRPITS